MTIGQQRPLVVGKVKVKNASQRQKGQKAQCNPGRTVKPIQRWMRWTLAYSP